MKSPVTYSSRKFHMHFLKNSVEPGCFRVNALERFLQASVMAYLESAATRCRLPKKTSLLVHEDKSHDFIFLCEGVHNVF